MSSTQRFCSKRCVARTQRLPTPPRVCSNCGETFEIRANEKPYRFNGRVLCSRQCRPTVPAAIRFWQKVDTSAGLFSCWLWTAALDANGYGRFGGRSESTLAHRFSLSLALGRPITTGKYVCHRCDNPPCVNPAHLYEGDQKDNMADMVAHGHSTVGSRNPYARLSEPQVALIKRRIATGEQFKAIAPDFGISPQTISMIARGLYWRHVEAAA